MAVWEARQQVTAAKGGNVISQVSWTDGTALDVYYWLDHSFQYASNINTDDELHWIKLSTYATFTDKYKHCQLTSLGEHWVAALDVTWVAMPKYFDHTNFGWNDSSWDEKPNPNTDYDVTPWVVFQDYFWYCIQKTEWQNNYVAFNATNVANIHSNYISVPRDHNEATDEDIATPNPTWDPMRYAVTAILNYNNTRLVVACGQDLWVYYPELDQNNPNRWGTWQWWNTWWKKVLTYEAWVTIVGLTCSFEYLKVWAVDEWWNTKVYYYQGNNDLRNTFVYNLVDLTGVRVLRVYSINWIDYYVTSLDGTDWFVNLYKLVWTTPVRLFKNRAWLSQYDVNYKAPYFVWPTSIWAWYWDGKFYIADAYGLFQFTYNPQSFDTGYMKWGLYQPHYYEDWELKDNQVYGVCENQGYLYVSTTRWCYMMRVLDTGKPPIDWAYGYQPSGVLISREFEWREWGTVTKMLDEIRLNFELNPLTDGNWTIDVYVSPNNLWKSTSEFTKANNWWHAMHITQDSAWTRAEKSNLFNNLDNWESAFKFDWQTITYAIVITRWTEDEATPIVREISIRYHCKDKINNVYDIN